MVWKETPPL